MKWIDRTYRVDRTEAFHLLVHLLLPTVLVASGILIADAMLASTPANCDYRLIDPPLPSLGIIVSGLTGLVAGRYLSKWSQPRPYRARPVAAVRVAFGAWFLVFSALVAVWWYEAMGTAHVAANEARTVDWEPITYYVRCAAYRDFARNGLGLWTAGLVALMSTIVGHWLWASHPPSGRRPAVAQQP